MPKKLIAILEGNLMRVAASKNITTLTALKEKTTVDRKTLRAINVGQPVKEKTLQSIADRLRVPLAHLIGPNTLDKREDVSDGDVYRRREIELQKLDANALRRLAEAGKITWLLKIDHMPEEVEGLLMRLEKALEGWFGHIAEIEFSAEHEVNLTEQISRVKTSADIDRIVEELAQRKLNIYGSTYVYWNKEQARHRHEDYPLPLLRYTSHHTAALCIVPEDKNISTVRVATGWEPPQQFVESTLSGIDQVEIDHKLVWFRENYCDEIPF